MFLTLLHDHLPDHHELKPSLALFLEHETSSTYDEQQTEVAKDFFHQAVNVLGDSVRYQYREDEQNKEGNLREDIRAFLNS